MAPHIIPLSQAPTYMPASYLARVDNNAATDGWLPVYQAVIQSCALCTIRFRSKEPGTLMENWARSFGSIIDTHRVCWAETFVAFGTPPPPLRHCRSGKKLFGELKLSAFATGLDPTGAQSRIGILAKLRCWAYTCICMYMRMWHNKNETRHLIGLGGDFVSAPLLFSIRLIWSCVSMGDSNRLYFCA
jgi:hypothetical protein